jgi:hypothetical protein
MLLRQFPELRHQRPVSMSLQKRQQTRLRLLMRNGAGQCFQGFEVGNRLGLVHFLMSGGSIAFSINRSDSILDASV